MDEPDDIPDFTPSAANRSYARRRAAEENLDPDFVDRIFTRESRYIPTAKSSQGAEGISQMVPGTQRQYGVTDPYDPVQSIEGGIGYLKDLHKQFNGDQRKVAAGYFAGPQSAERALRNPRGNPKTKAYVEATAKDDLPDFSAGDDLPDFSAPSTSAPKQGTAAPSYSWKGAKLYDPSGRAIATQQQIADAIRAFEYHKRAGNLDEARKIGKQLGTLGYEYGESEPEQHIVQPEPGTEGKFAPSMQTGQRWPYLKARQGQFYPYIPPEGQLTLPRTGKPGEFFGAPPPRIQDVTSTARTDTGLQLPKQFEHLAHTDDEAAYLKELGQIAEDPESAKTVADTLAARGALTEDRKRALGLGYSGPLGAVGEKVISAGAGITEGAGALIKGAGKLLEPESGGEFIPGTRAAARGLESAGQSIEEAGKYGAQRYGGKSVADLLIERGTRFVPLLAVPGGMAGFALGTTAQARGEGASVPQAALHGALSYTGLRFGKWLGDTLLGPSLQRILGTVSKEQAEAVMKAVDEGTISKADAIKGLQHYAGIRLAGPAGTFTPEAAENLRRLASSGMPIPAEIAARAGLLGAGQYAVDTAPRVLRGQRPDAMEAAQDIGIAVGMGLLHGTDWVPEGQRQLAAGDVEPPQPPESVVHTPLTQTVNPETVRSEVQDEVLRSAARRGDVAGTPGVPTVGVEPGTTATQRPRAAHEIAPEISELEQGRRPAVLVRQGDEMPETRGALESRGLAVTNVQDVGTFIHDPRQISRRDVRRLSQTEEGRQEILSGRVDKPDQYMHPLYGWGYREPGELVADPETRQIFEDGRPTDFVLGDDGIPRSATAIDRRLPQWVEPVGETGAHASVARKPVSKGEPEDAGTIRSDQGLVPGPGGLGRGSEGEGSPDVYRQREGRGQVEPSETTPTPQEPQARTLEEEREAIGRAVRDPNHPLGTAVRRISGGDVSGEAIASLRSSGQELNLSPQTLDQIEAHARQHAAVVPAPIASTQTPPRPWMVRKGEKRPPAAATPPAQPPATAVSPEQQQRLDRVTKEKKRFAEMMGRQPDTRETRLLESGESAAYTKRRLGSLTAAQESEIAEQKRQQAIQRRKELREEYRPLERGPTGPIKPEEQTLLQYIRSAGGIDMGSMSGERKRWRESRLGQQPRLFRRQGQGRPWDELMEQANSDGYGPFESHNDFFAALDDEVSGKPHFSTARESHLDEIDRQWEEYGKGEGLEPLQQDHAAMDAALNQPDVPEHATWLNAVERITNGDTSQEAIDALDKASQGIGLSPEGRERIARRLSQGLSPAEEDTARSPEAPAGSQELIPPDYDADDEFAVVFDEPVAGYGDLPTDQYDRVVKKLEAIKKQAASERQPLSVAISDYLSQKGLFGSELSDRQQALLQELGTRVRRAAENVEQGSLFGDMSPTVESETEKRRGEQALAPQGGLFGEEGPQYGLAPENRGTWKGKRFWSGLVNIHDGEIETTATFERAEDADFHHRLYLPEEKVRAMDDGDLGFFWVDDRGKVQGQLANGDDLPDNILDDLQRKVAQPSLRETSVEYETRSSADRNQSLELAQAAIESTARAVDTVSAAGGTLARTRRGVEAGSGVRTVASGIARELIREGRVDLRGRDASTLEKVAEIGQVFRDPRYETFRIIAVDDDGQIVAHQGITSRMPGTTTAFAGKPGDKSLARHFHGIKRWMERSGATGYYLMHNHPSGSPRASAADVNATALWAVSVPGFKGHVIIDSGTYGQITVAELPLAKARQHFDRWQSQPGVAFESRLTGAVSHLRGGNVQAIQRPLPSGKPVETQEIPHGALSRIVTKPEDIIDIGQMLKAPEGFVTVIHRSAQGNARGVQDMPVNLALRPDEAADFIRGQQRRFGAVDSLIYSPTENKPLWDSAVELIKRGAIVDYAEANSPMTPHTLGARRPAATEPRAGVRVDEPAPDDYLASFLRDFGPKEKHAEAQPEGPLDLAEIEGRIDTMSPDERATTLTRIKNEVARHVVEGREIARRCAESGARFTIV